MNQLKFAIQPRKITGKKVKQLRRKGVVPGNVYKPGGESLLFQFSNKEFIKLYSEAGDTGLVYLQPKGEKKPRPTLIDEVQVDPVSGDVLHVSFKEVDLKEKIEADVPVEVIGEFEVKEAVLVTVRNEITVEALPTDLPEKFVVDVTELTEVGEMISFKDLDFDREKVSLVDVVEEEDWEKPVVLVQEQREEVKEEAPVEGEEVEGEAPKGEGAEGEQAPATEGGENTSSDDAKNTSSNDAPAEKKE